MEKNTIIIGTVAIAVTVIILASMIPVMLDSSENIISISENDIEGRYTYSISSAPDLTISIGSSVVKVNDYELTPTTQTILAACDEWAVFAFNTSNIYVLYDGAYDTVKASTDVTISGSTLSYTKGDSTSVTKDVVGDVLYATNNNPTHVGVISSSTFKIDASSAFYFFKNPSLNNSALDPTSISPIAFGKGTVESVEYLVMNISGVTASSIEFAADPAETDGHLTASNAFKASVTNATGTYSADSVTYGVYVPIEYKEITQTDSQVRDIIGIIPMLLVVAVLFMAVAIAFKLRA